MNLNNMNKERKFILKTAFDDDHYIVGILKNDEYFVTYWFPNSEQAKKESETFTIKDGLRVSQEELIDLIF